VLKVVEKKDGSVVPFAEAKEEITRRLAQQRMASAYDEYVAGLRKTALVDLKVREVPLSVDLPAGPGLEAPTVGTVPAAPAAAAPAPTSPAAEDLQEFTTSPQARPERVTAPSLPGEPAPAPTPNPAPTPTPNP